MVRILIWNDQKMLRDIPLVKSVIEIGRSSGCDIQLASIGVSRKHAKISRINGQYYLEDMGSQNGVYLNRTKIQHEQLHSRDNIGIHAFSLIFIADDEAESLSVPHAMRAVTRADSAKAQPPIIAATKPKFMYDVAFSFAGTERGLVEEIATIVRSAGFNVFYDDFYPEQLWGKDLSAHFDNIYRKQSRFCVMLISREYANRMWTTHERRSATARTLLERGNEYILPVKVEDVDIDGIPSSLGYVSVAERSMADIADLLIRKLKT